LSDSNPFTLRTSLSILFADIRTPHIVCSDNTDPYSTS